MKNLRDIAFENSNIIENVTPVFPSEFRNKNRERIVNHYNQSESIIYISDDCFKSPNLKSVYIPSSGSLANIFYDERSVVDVVLDARDFGINIAVLNFANALYPGGGYINGSMAQEEALCYSSDLFNILNKEKQFYDANKAYNISCIYPESYTNSIIYSKNICFFRDSQMEFIENFSFADILTCPAVNFNSVRTKNPSKADWNKYKEIMKIRMENILKVFYLNSATNIVLGAFGCGAFGCNISDIMNIWRELLFEEGYARLFDNIVFCVKDKNPNAMAITKMTIGVE